MRVRKLVTLPVRLPLRLIQKLTPKLRRSPDIDTPPARPSEPTPSDGGKNNVVIDEQPTREAPPPPPPEDCPICHDPVGLPNPEGTVEAWTSLHCGHRFGTACIQTWLQDSLDRNDPHSPDPTCPICRLVAKHPACGHPVCPSPSFELQWNLWQLQLQYRHQAVAAAAAQHRRPRNRLQRREGHPLRPSFEPPKRAADTVGECGTCAQRKKDRLEDAASIEREQRIERRLGRKASLPFERVLLGMGRVNSSGEPSSPPEDFREMRGRSMICDLDDIFVPRRPTPAPVVDTVITTRARPLSTAF